MSDEQAFDYGPLQGLIGEWAGDKRIDVAPEPDDTERNFLRQRPGSTQLHRVFYQNLGPSKSRHQVLSEKTRK